MKRTPSAYDAALSYAKSQRTTGFLVMRDDQMLVEENWPVAAGAPEGFFRTFGVDAHAALLEDVASQQKSLMSILAGAAVDKGLLDVMEPVSTYVGAGWSKTSLQQEQRIAVLNILEMNTGLKPDFTFDAPPKTKFLYNTPVYTMLGKVLEGVSHQKRDDFTRLWLTGPAEMNDTNWCERGVEFAGVGNPLGLVTTPRDVAKLGRIILGRGIAANGRRIISSHQLQAILSRSPTNPGYGRLWWLNGGDFAIRPGRPRTEGPLIAAAPADLVAALGAMGRKLYVVPSLRLVIVRVGQQPSDPAFDQHLWIRLMKAGGD
ncbi:MAG: serine hydrolase domain-containing protein [Caulobacteraceae bacterium]